MKAARIAPIALTLLVLVAAQAGNAYQFLNQRWNDGTVTMHLQQGSPNSALLDGATSWNTVSEGALASWNSQIGRLQFRVERNSTAGIQLRNNINNVFWDDDLYGDSFDDAVAVALTLASNGRTSEVDVVFNTQYSWNSYRGNTRYSGNDAIYYLRRVALHEFGHVLGLDHPDQHGQSVTAVMNHRISNVDSLQTDDINGGRALYGAPTAPPPPTDRLEPDARMGLNTSITSPNGTYRLLYQNDGNLVLYTSNSPVWATDTGGSNASPAILQSDGNFVIYNAAGIARWATNTGGQGRARLILQNDGNVVLYRISDGQPIWDRSRSVPPFPLPTSTTVSETLTGTASTSSAACSGSGSGSSPCVRHSFSVGSSGTIEGRLTWSTAGNDLDLELWRGSTRVASSDGVTTTETVSTSVTAGSYEWRVVYYGGTSAQSYSLAVTRPN